MKIELEKIIEGIELGSFGGVGESQSFLNKETGEVFYYSEYSDNEEELPEDFDNDKYIELPHKNELDLGKSLVLNFASSHIPDDYEKIEEIFSKKGAYSRYKDFLESKGILEKWYEYEQKAFKEAVRDWCQYEEIEIIG